MTNKGFENWLVIRNNTLDDGRQQVTYGFKNHPGHKIVVTESKTEPGGACIVFWPDKRCLLDIRIQKNEEKNVQEFVFAERADYVSITKIDKLIAAYKEAQEVAKEIMRAYPQCFKNEKVAR